MHNQQSLFASPGLLPDGRRPIVPVPIVRVGGFLRARLTVLRDIWLSEKPRTGYPTKRLADRPQRFAVGDIVEARPIAYHKMLGTVGDRYQVGRVTERADGPSYWGHPQAKRATAAKGRNPGVRLGEFITGQQCPLGNGGDFTLVASATPLPEERPL